MEKLKETIEIFLKSKEPELVRLRKHAFIHGFLWTVVISMFLFQTTWSQNKEVKTIAENIARASFYKDQAFRFWAASHGGIYVPITELTPPNPNLSHIPDRDINKPDGTKLTLMNPAFMIRQMMDGYPGLYGAKSKITSLKYFYAGNKPDGWEVQALKSFEQGNKEAFEYTEIDNQPYLRLIRPMTTKEKCLKCHVVQGYKVGDIRGGVGISVPMQPLYNIVRPQYSMIVFGYLVLWLLGLAGIGIFSAREAIFQEELKKYRKHLEELVEKRTEALEKINIDYANANQELKEFAYIVSHDLKAPLRAISQLTHWISEDYADSFDAEGREQMDLILNRAKRMDALIDGILRYSRIGRIEGKPEELDLNLLVKEVIENLAPPNNVKIIVANKLPVVLKDPTRMGQVFQNLIGNAIKFMDKDAGVIKVGCVEEGEFWEFSVADNGPGIDEKYHDRIFQIFQTLTARDEKESTGIGLTLVKKIIKLYGGSIWLESQVGQGATFFFTLPKKGK